MQAWGSLLGVGVSTLAVIITGLLLRHEMRARRDDKEDAEVAQARLVYGDIHNPAGQDSSFTVAYGSQTYMPSSRLRMMSWQESISAFAVRFGADVKASTSGAAGPSVLV